MASRRWNNARSLTLVGLTMPLALAIGAMPAVAAADDPAGPGLVAVDELGPADATGTADAADTGDASGPAAESSSVPDDTDAPVTTAGPADGEEAGPTEVVTVEGTLVNLAVEATDPEHAHPSGMTVESMVEVDGMLFPIPEDVPVTAGPTGQAVEVALAADAELDPVDALAIATAQTPAPGSSDDVDRAEDLPEGAAEVLAVNATSGSTAAAQVLAQGAIGSHTLTVLPVYWDAAPPSSPTTSTLKSLADQTAQYWSEQSAGRITTATAVRAWAKIAPPTGCDTVGMFSNAMKANGLTTGTNQHFLVYFPQRSDCGGWAGLASIGGGQIWVNGAPIIDVFAHEYGHNLGLGHANRLTCTSGGTRVPLAALSSCTSTEYADTADVMGFAISGRASGNLNTAFADHLGLAKVVRPSTSAPTTVDLSPLSSFTATRAIAIPVSGGTVYIDYRPKAGRDVREPNWAGVQVHLRTMDPTIGYPTTYLLDMKAPTGSAFSSPAMPVGGSWTVPGASLVVSVTSLGSVARVQVAPGTAGLSPAQTAVQSYIKRVYQHLFQRGVDPTGLQTWTTRLLQGTPRIAVANGITYSREYRSRLITGSYRTYLGRGPDPTGLENWLRAMDRGLTIQDMEAGFLASQEYYGKAGGTDAGWVRKLYQHVLGRNAASSEVAHWVNRLAAGATRDDVAKGFLYSTEHLTTVIDGYYVQLLGRHIDARGKATWVSNIQGGRRVEEVIGGIIASDEYFNKG